ncbi:MAG: ATP-binding protein [Acidobacteriota bacterium]|nr:ATP-binding protein [Acidobacteriota bacterium]
MRRSLFFALLVRLLVGFAAVAVLWYWLPRWWIDAAVGLLVAAAVAWSCSRLLVRDFAALEQAARNSSEQDAVLACPKFRELDGLATALENSAAHAARGLAQSVEGRRELEALLDSMQDAVVAVDASGRIQWTNEPMRKLIPGNPASSVRVGHALVQTIRDPEVLACVSAALGTQEVAEGRAMAVVPGRIFDVSAAPMPQGGAVAVLRDVTRVEQMERAQKDFVANVSHELRTPLTSISGYVETLLEDEPDGMAREFLGTIRKNAVRMNRLTEDLLVLARVESGEHAVRPVRVRALALVNEAYDSIAGLVRDSGAELELHEVVDTEVMADMDAVVRVLTNLIENATKYGRGEFETRIVVSAIRTEDRPNMVRFSVQDFGPGIPSEHIGRLFERFYRVDKGRSRESGGTGLGLAIARRLTEAQHGEIWVESELAHGSMFCFTLPVANGVDQLALDLAVGT